MVRKPIITYRSQNNLCKENIMLDSILGVREDKPKCSPNLITMEAWVRDRAAPETGCRSFRSII